MRREEKEKRIQEIKKIVDESKGIFLFDFQGLTVAEINDLRSRAKKSGGAIKVVKNKLVKKALEGGYDAFPKELLQRPTAFAYSMDDFIALVKLLFEFKKETGKIEIKGAYVEGKSLELPEIEALSKLPPKEVLMAQIGGALAAPLRNFLMNLRAPLQNFANLLYQLKEKKDKEGK